MRRSGRGYGLAYKRAFGCPRPASRVAASSDARRGSRGNRDMIAKCGYGSPGHISCSIRHGSQVVVLISREGLQKDGGWVGDDQ